MLHESEANDKAQGNGGPSGMYKTLKHGCDRTSRVVWSNAGLVAPSCLKIASLLDPVHQSIAQSTVAWAAGRKAKRNTPAQRHRKEIAMTPASPEQTYPRWLLIALWRIVGF